MRVRIAVLWGFFALLSALGRTESLTIFTSNDSKFGAVITTTDRSPDGGGFKGTGSIVFTLAGIKLPAIGPMPYKGLMVSGSQITGGTITTSKDEKLSNVFGSGLDLVLANGSSMSLSGNPLTLTLSGAASIVAPFKDESNNSLKATISQFSISANGAASGKASISLAKPIVLPGVSVNTGTFNLAFTVPPSGSPSVSWNCPSAQVSIGMPGMTTHDDHAVDLQATNVSFDADGLLSFNATFNGPQPITVSLAQPSNFSLSLTYANVVMTKSSITSGDFKGSLTLPPMFSSDKSGSTGDPVTIKNIEVKADSSGVVVSAGTGQIDLYWNGFHLKVPASGGTPNFILDLSDKLAVAGEVSPEGTPLPASWQGFFIKAATLELPDSFGGGASLDVKNMLIESGGLSGKFTASGAALAKLSPPGFPGKIDSISLTFLKSQVADFDAEGEIALGGDVGNIGVKIGCSESGVFTLSLNQSSPVSLGPLGIDLQIDQGTFTYDGKGTASLKITGSISVPENAGGPLAFLKGAAFAVKDLSVDNHGHFSITSAWLDLPHPATVSLGPVNLVLSQIGIGTDPQGRPTVSLTGDVSISELPINGQIGFKGLTISAGGVDIGGISLDVEVPNVLKIKADIEYDELDGTRDVPQVPQWHGQKEKIFKGNASIELDCFGPSGGIGGSAHFLVANTGWYVTLGVDLGHAGIVLGPTPFSLFGFLGGMGHNVEAKVPGSTGIPGIDYDLVPYAPGQKGEEWMFMAGVRIGTSDLFTVWGDIVLSLMFGDALIIDLDGKIGIAESPNGITGDPDAVPADRLVHANIHYDGPTSTFHASVSADLNFPTKASSIIEVIGSMDLLISPNDKHFYIGGPIGNLPPPPLQPPDIQNPITVKFLNGAIQGPEAALDVDINNNSFSFKTALIAGGSLNESIDCGIFSVGIKASLQQWIYAAVAFNTSPSFSLQGGAVGLGINASVDLYLSCWLGSAD